MFEHVDERAIPGEFVWDAEGDTFHSIFDDVHERPAIQVDAVGRRVSWHDFSTQEWAEGVKHDLARSRVFVQRRHDVAGLIAARTAYADRLRVERLGESIVRAEYLLTDWRLERWVERGGWLGANDQVDAGGVNFWRR